MKKINKNAFFNLNALVVLVFIVVLALTLVSMLKIITSSAPDFSVLYKSTYDFAHKISPYQDKSLYTAFNYPPVTSIIYSVFLNVYYPLAQGIFTTVSFLSVFVIVFISLKLLDVKLPTRYFFIFSTLTLLAFPVKFTLGMGQSNLLSFTFLLLGYFFYKKKLLKISSFLTCLSLIVKPVLVFMMLFFVFKREWRLILYVSVFVVSFFILSILFFGLDSYLFYFTSVIPKLFKISGREVYYNQGSIGFISRLFNDAILRNFATFLINFFVIFCTFYLFIKKKIHDNVLFSLLLIVLLIIDTLSWQHHFVFLIFPFIVTTAIIIKKERSISLYSALVISYVFASSDIKDTSFFLHFPYSLVLSNTFYGTFILLLLIVKLSLGKQKKS